MLRAVVVLSVSWLACSGPSQATAPSSPSPSPSESVATAPAADSSTASKTAEQVERCAGVRDEPAKEGAYGDGSDLAEREAGCKAGVAADCMRAMQIYENGWGVAVDADKAQGFESAAVTTLTRDCEAACVGEPCFRLGFYYQMVKRSAKGPAVFRKAAAIYERRCEEGHGRACDGLATLHQFGWGVPAARDTAKSLREKACQLGYQGACAGAQ